MNEDEFEYMEQMALDNYMEERGYGNLNPDTPWNELPTLDDWLNA
jgi:hypothetical protein